MRIILMNKKKLNRSSEILFEDNFEMNGEKSYSIWNYLNHTNETYLIKKESSTLYVLYLNEKEVETKLPILNFYGIWSDLTDDDISFMEDSIRNIHKRIFNKYYNE